MKSSNQYHTKQRELVRGALLASAGRHVTAEDIELLLRERGTPVGRSTVYRHLSALVEEGGARKYITEEGAPACYQHIDCGPACNANCHLKCSVCGALLHVECPSLEAAARELSDRYSFEVDSAKTVLYGRCGGCGGN